MSFRNNNGGVTNPLTISDGTDSAEIDVSDGSATVSANFDGADYSSSTFVEAAGDDDDQYAFAAFNASVGGPAGDGFVGAIALTNTDGALFCTMFPFTTLIDLSDFTHDDTALLIARDAGGGIPELLWVDPDGTEHIIAEATP